MNSPLSPPLDLDMPCPDPCPEQAAVLLAKAGAYLSAEFVAKIRRAYELGALAHQGQTRKSGEAYITHPIAVAEILADQHMDGETLCAAILHDAGYLINPRQHHKHAYYLIKHGDIGGFTAQEIEMIANIARYHRRALPAFKHEGFDGLPLRLQRTVKILSSLLRIADGLDRTHFTLVQTLHVKFGKVITISITVTGDAEMELWAAKSRADLFELVFHRRVAFSQTIHASTKS